MCVNTDNVRADLLGEPLQLVDFEQRHSELRMNASRLYMLMVTSSLPGIHAHEDPATLE